MKRVKLNETQLRSLVQEMLNEYGRKITDEEKKKYEFLKADDVKAGVLTTLSLLSKLRQISNEDFGPAANKLADIHRALF